MKDIKIKSKASTPLKKTLSTIPGDKSISHRAVIIGALANNTSHFNNFLCSEDCLNTMRIFQKLNIPIEINTQEKTLKIEGKGYHGLRQPKDVLDVGNSGTGIRLITGILSAQPFQSTITGDTSIQSRPMDRIITPLKKMGASVTGITYPEKKDSYPPLVIKGNTTLSPIQYSLPIASAQVKSALLLASLFSQEPSTIIEKKASRNHTEIMLQTFGAAISVSDSKITCSGQRPLQFPSVNSLTIPSDFSSAAFFIVLGLLRKNTVLILKNIGLNPTRSALLNILIKMGGRISLSNVNKTEFEQSADIKVESSQLKNVDIPQHLIPFLIDEIPILSIAGLFATGPFKISHAKELRVKESDRIQSIADMIESMGGNVTISEDGFAFEPRQNNSPFVCHSHGDHRIAMSAIIAAISQNVQATIHNCDCIDTSFPNFIHILEESLQVL